MDVIGRYIQKGEEKGQREKGILVRRLSGEWEGIRDFRFTISDLRFTILFWRESRRTVAGTTCTKNASFWADYYCGYTGYIKSARRVEEAVDLVVRVGSVRAER